MAPTVNVLDVIVPKPLRSYDRTISHTFGPLEPQAQRYAGTPSASPIYYFILGCAIFVIAFELRTRYVMDRKTRNALDDLPLPLPDWIKFNTPMDLTSVGNLSADWKPCPDGISMHGYYVDKETGEHNFGLDPTHGLDCSGLVFGYEILRKEKKLSKNSDEEEEGTLWLRMWVKRGTVAR